MRNIVVSTFLFMIVLASAASAEVFSGVAAIVNDEIITTLELNREYAQVSRETEKREGVLNPDAAKKLRTVVMDSMIDRMLVRQKIKELNIIISEEELRQSIEEIKKQNKMSQEALVAALLSQGMTFDQYKAQMKDQLERLRLMSQEVKSKVQVSDKDVKDFYDANLASFSDAEAYRARVIFLRLSKDATTEAIRKVMARLETVMAEVKKGSDFKELAKKYSDDANVQQDGGDLGFFKKGEMHPDIEKIVVTLKPGEVEMITTAAGSYVIKLEEKKPGLVKPFETVKGQIEENLYRKRSEERFSKWLEELRKGAAIEIKQ